jgi:hypothetical protein
MTRRKLILLILLYAVGFYGTGALQASRACPRVALFRSREAAVADSQLGVLFSGLLWPVILPILALDEIRDRINPALRTCPAADGAS